MINCRLSISKLLYGVSHDCSISASHDGFNFSRSPVDHHLAVAYLSIIGGLYPTVSIRVDNSLRFVGFTSDVYILNSDLPVEA